jgi:hypothetical protein
MLPRNFMIKFAALMLVTVLLAGLPASIYAAQNDTWQPGRPAPGTGSVVFINHIGQGGGVTVDLAGTVYKVSDKVNDLPSRLQINLAPGTYAFTVSAFDSAASHTVEVMPGQVTGLNFIGAGSQLVVHNTNDEDRATTRSYKFTDVAVVFDDITDQAQ